MFCNTNDHYQPNMHGVSVNSTCYSLWLNDCTKSCLYMWWSYQPNKLIVYCIRDDYTKLPVVSDDLAIVSMI